MAAFSQYYCGSCKRSYSQAEIVEREAGTTEVLFHLTNTGQHKETVVRIVIKCPQGHSIGFRDRDTV
jgi:hypothetical protein